ncbi:NUDIX domain-containing protein [Microbacterium sp. CIAB417]|uniref:NUDIX domain-containing protein n=1 Tax=Microbacterium sp. CIAB417 TaxID=2860287 RepID=UPI001FAB8B7E|nr:NUDIX domain-containing protein [Microbacterium sp. CIAB417]
MTIVPPTPGEPRRPEGPRDPGDAWVVAESGERYWGRFGAAGLLAVDADRGVLLQHRVSWSHFGGTWGLPGGALHEGESAIVGAEREATEEAGVPDGAVRARFTSVLDLRIWSYTTVIADVLVPFDPVISDPESVALEWVPVEDVDDRPLHPGFADAWPRLRALLDARPALVVDAANVVGSVPDGWWRDRAGAAGRLASALAGLAVPAGELGLGGDEWFPEISFVVEGQAKAIAADAGGERVRIVPAPGEGDDAILAEAERLVGDGRAVIVVTSDRGLQERVNASGADVRSAGWLRGLI